MAGKKKFSGKTADIRELKFFGKGNKFVGTKRGSKKK